MVTIVTVCFNAEREIRKTLESVLNQTFTNFEYIVKDGNSKDKTNEIICEYEEKFKNKGISFIHIKSRDRGIYDAMNIATYKAKRKYINYMNVGDIFYDKHVLEKIFSKNQNASIIYGDSICEYEFATGKKEYTYWKGRHDTLSQMPFSHQACFFKTNKVLEKKYDINYKSAADYKLILEIYKDSEEFMHYNDIVSICTMNGVSNQNIKRSYLETLDIQRKSGIVELRVRNIILKKAVISIKQLVIDIFPKRLLGNILRFNLMLKHERLYASVEEIKEKI